MSSTPNSSASESPFSSMPTSVLPTPSGSPRLKPVQKSFTNLRLALVRNDSSFTRAVTSALKSHDTNLDLSETLANTSLDTSTKDLIKKDIRLVKTVTSAAEPETKPEVPPLVFPKPAWPHILCKPAPKTKAAFIGSVEYELKMCGWLKNGLNTYIRVIHSEEHTVFSDDFLKGEMITTNKMQAELDEYKVKLLEIEAEIKQIVTPAGTPSVDADKMGQAEINDYFTATWDDKVETQLVEKYDVLKPLVHKIRSFFVSAHVWYKINYALCPDKDKVAKAETEEGTALVNKVIKMEIEK